MEFLAHIGKEIWAIILYILTDLGPVIKDKTRIVSILHILTPNICTLEQELEKDNHKISPEKSCQGSLTMVVGTSCWHKNQ